MYYEIPMFAETQTRMIKLGIPYDNKKTNNLTYENL